MFEDRAKVFEVLGNGFAGRPVLVVGDVMLDRYLWGEVSRISPEAPVPVVRLTRESEGCGGAANVALNLAGLGAKPVLAGFIGTDDEGERLKALLAQRGVEITPMVALADRPTIAKTRVIGGHQQMLRLDREESRPISTGDSARLLGVVNRVLEHTPPAAVILSDYAKGVLSEGVCREIIHRARGLGIPVLVDPKGSDYGKYRQATVLTPNRKELGAALGMEGVPLEALLTAAAPFRERLEVRHLAVTLSELGIALIQKNQLPQHIPAMAREVFDVSGAGDTVIATLAAGLACGLGILDALHLANLAAGVVVGRVGTTPIGLADLLTALSAEEAMDQSRKVCSLEEAQVRVGIWRGRGEQIVFTNGCFDLLHAGHVNYLEKARRLGQRLIVGLNTDRSVRELKGPTRPVIHQNDRARVLAALESVDAVVLFDEETPLTLIRTLRPDILAKGADYTEEQVVGGAEVKSWGGRVALVPLTEGRSTSTIVAAIQGG